MAQPPRTLWPFSPRASLLSVPVILIALVVLIAVSRQLSGWPSEAADKYVVVGILLLSVAPILLALVDTLASQGAVVEFRGVKLNFADLSPAGSPAARVATNIGVPWGQVSDSSSAQILESLRKAVGNEVVVLDLEDGHAWWETRLLALLAGAVRLGRPRAVVFVATIGGRGNRFQGWGRSDQMLPYLLEADPRYRTIYRRVQAAGRQWDLVEPVDGGPPVLPVGMTGLAAGKLWMAFDPNTGIENELAAEQLLVSKLGESIENVEPPKAIGIVRLQELFAPVLVAGSVEENSPVEEQIGTLVKDDSEYVAITREGEYVHLVRRVAAIAAVVESLVESTKS